MSANERFLALFSAIQPQQPPASAPPTAAEELGSLPPAPQGYGADGLRLLSLRPRPAKSLAAQEEPDANDATR